MGTIKENISEAPKVLKLICFYILPINLLVHVVSLSTKDWYYQNTTMHGLFERELDDRVFRLDGKFLDDKSNY